MTDVTPVVTATKSIFLSRTMIGLAVTALSLVVQKFGYTVDADLQGQIVDTVTTLAAGFGVLLAAWGRVKASKGLHVVSPKAEQLMGLAFLLLAFGSLGACAATPAFAMVPPAASGFLAPQANNLAVLIAAGLFLVLAALICARLARLWLSPRLRRGLRRGLALAGMALGLALGLGGGLVACGDYRPAVVMAQTPQQKVFALQGDYTALMAPVVAYATSPDASPVVVKHLKELEAVAYEALKTARADVRTGSNSIAVDASLAAARQAITTLSAYLVLEGNSK